MATILLLVFHTCGIPKSVLQIIEKYTRDLFGGEQSEGSRHLVAWETICKEYQLGNLNIKSCKEFHESFLAKQVSKISRCPQNMVRMVKSRYSLLAVPNKALKGVHYVEHYPRLEPVTTHQMRGSMGLEHI